MTNDNEYIGFINFMFKKTIWIVIAVAVTVLVVLLYIVVFHSVMYTAETTMIIRKTGDAGYPGSTGYLNTSEFEVYSKMINDCESFVKSRYFYSDVIKDNYALKDINYQQYLGSVSVESELDSNIFHVAFSSRRDEKLIEIANVISIELINNYSEVIVDGEVKIIDKAFDKKSYFIRDLVFYLISATFASAGMAIVFVFLWYFRSPHIKSIYELEKKIKDINSVIQLKVIKRKNYKKNILYKTSIVKRVLSSYKLFSDRLYIAKKRENIKTILVTSPNKDSNKTQLCAFICKFLVEKKLKVALINLENYAAYADYYNQIKIENFITCEYRKNTRMRNGPIDVFTIDKNKMLNEKTVSSLFETIKSDTKYDFIIINSPSVLNDNIMLNRYEELDKVILTISELKTIKEDAFNVIELLETYINNLIFVYMKT